MSAPSPVSSRLAEVRERIADAARRAGRSPSNITLIGVTKTVPAARVQEVVDAGLSDIGENKVQEAESKTPSVRTSSRGKLTWHLVGHLQQNKARRALELFSWIHSVDSEGLAKRLDHFAEELGVTPKILVEVNIAAESSKNGVAPDRLGPLLEAIDGCSHLNLYGLMAVPPILPAGADAAESRPHFRSLMKLRDTWRSRGYDLPALSMGMSDDFEIAVEEGATHVRVGRALFGDRPAARPVREQRPVLRRA